MNSALHSFSGRRSATDHRKQQTYYYYHHLNMKQEVGRSVLLMLLWSQRTEQSWLKITDSVRKRFHPHSIALVSLKYNLFIIFPSFCSLRGLIQTIYQTRNNHFRAVESFKCTKCSQYKTFPYFYTFLLCKTKQKT